MDFLSICVHPLFRYSAPFVVWTDTELQNIDKMFITTMKAALNISPSAASAPFALPRRFGGAEFTGARMLQVKETLAHVNQCTQHDDELNDLMKYVTALVSESVGGIKPHECQADDLERSIFSQCLLCPIWRAQFLSLIHI